MKRTCTPGPDPPKKRRRRIRTKCANENSLSSGGLKPNSGNSENKVINDSRTTVKVETVSPCDDSNLSNLRYYTEDKLKEKHESKVISSPKVEPKDCQIKLRTSTEGKQPTLKELFSTLCPDVPDLSDEAQEKQTSE